MVRLPQVGQDDGKWGGILNEFLEVEHESDGKLKADGSLASKFGNDQDLIPAADDTYSVGSSQFRWKKMHTTQFDMVHKTGDGTHTVTNQQGSVVAGALNATSGYTAKLEALNAGALAGGYIDTENWYQSGNANITAGGTGAFAWGSINRSMYAYGADLSISATGNGAFAMGGIGTASTTASGSNSFAQGEGAVASGSGSFAKGSDAVASGNHSWAQGWQTTASGSYSFAQGSQTVASGSRSFAQGYGTVVASSLGSFAQGSAEPGSDGINSQGPGSFAQGVAAYYSGSEIRATKSGSFAQGLADYSKIIADGFGSFAQGAVRYHEPEIVASAENSVQFGPGTNSQADSLKVGSSGLRIKGTTGAPGTPVNGDIWVASGYVYIQSNGSAVKIGA